MTAEDRLNSPNNILNELNLGGDVVPIRAELRPLHNRSMHMRKDVPHPLKVTAGILAHFEPASHVAKNFGLHTASVTRYAKGMVGNGTELNHELGKDVKSGVDKICGEIRTRALDKLMGAIESISTTKLEQLSAVDASKVASGMAGVFEKLGDKVPNVGGGNIIFYAPRTKGEHDYEVVNE